MQYWFFVLFFLNFVNPNNFNKIDMFVVPSELLRPSVIDEINWKVILSEILREPLFLNEITPGSVVLINMIRNNTNGPLQVVKITNILIELFINNIKQFNIISIEQLYHAYRELQISSEEILNSYAFSIDIAHYLNADYIIYSIVSGDLENPHIELQLILSKTGEIIRSINRSISYNDCINK